VGVIVSYQMMQAGARVAAVIDAAPKIGGYAVHAAKIARAGVPFFMSHTIKEAQGKERVEGATIIEVDDNWNPLPGTEKQFEVDTVCIAVGLNPATQLIRMAGCKMANSPVLGGQLPAHDLNQETSIKGLYVAGDAQRLSKAGSQDWQLHTASATWMIPPSCPRAMNNFKAWWACAAAAMEKSGPKPRNI
jgi:thioredoxin reductase